MVLAEWLTDVLEQAWGHEVTQNNAHLRQLLVACGNLLAYTINAWLPRKSFFSRKIQSGSCLSELTPHLVLMWPTYDAPHYKYAYQLLILFGGLGIIGTYIFDYLHKREL